MENNTTGNLSNTPLHELLIQVFQTRFSGTMVLVKGEVKKSFVFEQGKPVSARSNILEESLGSIMISEGRISKTQLQKCLHMLEEHEAGKTGEALVTMKLIDQPGLMEMLRKQFMKRLVDIFCWKEGKYGFVTEIPKELARIEILDSLPEVIFRGLVEKYKIGKEVSALNMDIKPMVSSGTNGIVIDQLKLAGKELGLYRLINGTNTLTVITTKSNIDANVVKAMILALRDLGVLRIDDGPTRAVQPVKPVASPAQKIPKINSAMGLEIVQKLEACKSQNFFQILGLTEKATIAEVKKVYFDFAKKYHPDRLPVSTPPEERKVAEAYFARITEAHATISNPAARKEYESSLQLKAEGVEADKVTDIIQSEMDFQKGRILIKKGDYAGAIQSLQTAIKLYDKEPEYNAYLGWALYREGKQKQNPAAQKKGRDMLEKALKEKEKMAEAHFFLGLIYKGDEEFNKAKRCFEHTVELAPHHTEAASELRVMNMREEKKQAGGGGLKGLFGKKKEK